MLVPSTPFSTNRRKAAASMSGLAFGGHVMEHVSERSLTFKQRAILMSSERSNPCPLLIIFEKRASFLRRSPTALDHPNWLNFAPRVHQLMQQRLKRAGSES